MMLCSDSIGALAGIVLRGLDAQPHRLSVSDSADESANRASRSLWRFGNLRSRGALFPTRQRGSHRTHEPSLAECLFTEVNAGTPQLRLLFAILSVCMRGSASDCERNRFGLSGKDLMVGVDQFDPHLVLSGRHSGQVDRINTTSIRP
jgi:hypothetical protein